MIAAMKVKVGWVRTDLIPAIKKHFPQASVSIDRRRSVGQYGIVLGVDTQSVLMRVLIAYKLGLHHDAVVSI